MNAFFCVLATLFAFASAEAIGVQIDHSAVEISACNSLQCNQTCITAHFEGGLCMDGECWCLRYGQSANRIGTRMREIQSSSRGIAVPVQCKDSAECDLYCKSIQQDGGLCADGYCWCRKHGESGLILRLKSEIESATPQSCDVDNCFQECHDRRYNGGLCRNEECTCWKNRADRWTWIPMNDLPAHFTDKTGNAVDACTDTVQCLDACQHHGAAGGFCMERVCWCSMFYGRKKPANRRVRPITDLQGSIAGNSVDENATCDRTVCKRLCENSFGVCLYGYCWCPQSQKQEVQEPIWKKLKDIPK